MNQPLAALASPHPRLTKAQLRHTQSGFDTFSAHRHTGGYLDLHGAASLTSQVDPVATRERRLSGTPIVAQHLAIPSDACRAAVSDSAGRTAAVPVAARPRVCGRPPRRARPRPCRRSSWFISMSRHESKSDSSHSHASATPMNCIRVGGISTRCTESAVRSTEREHEPVIARTHQSEPHTDRDVYPLSYVHSIRDRACGYRSA